MELNFETSFVVFKLSFNWTFFYGHFNIFYNIADSLWYSILTNFGGIFNVTRHRIPFFLFNKKSIQQIWHAILMSFWLSPKNSGHIFKLPPPPLQSQKMMQLFNWTWHYLGFPAISYFFNNQIWQMLTFFDNHIWQNADTIGLKVQEHILIVPLTLLWNF